MAEPKGLNVLQAGGVDPLGDGPQDASRRAFMRTAAAGAAVSALAGCGVDLGDLLPRHFKELSKGDLAKVLAKVEKRNKERFGRDTKVTAEGPRPGVEFGYGLDISRCVGCRRCVYACVKEIVVDGKLTVAPTLQKLKPEPRPVRPEELRESKRPAATQEAGR